MDQNYLHIGDKKNSQNWHNIQSLLQSTADGSFAKDKLVLTNYSLYKATIPWELKIIIIIIIIIIFIIIIIINIIIIIDDDVEVILQSPWLQLYEGLQLTLLVAWTAARAGQEYPRVEEPTHFEGHQSFDLKK